MPAIGALPPLRMFLAVRAIAPSLRIRRTTAPLRLYALADEFLIRVVTRAGHTVGDHRRQQRLDRTEHCDRERRTDRLDGCTDAKSGRCSAGRLRGIPPNAEPMVATPSGMMEHTGEHGRDREADDRPRQTLQTRHARRGDDDRERQCAQRRGRQMKRGERTDRTEQFLVKMLATTPCRPKKSFHSPVQMITAMPAVKPTIDRIGNELDDRAEVRCRAAQGSRRQTSSQPAIPPCRVRR